MDNEILPEFVLAAGAASDAIAEAIAVFMEENDIDVLDVRVILGALGAVVAFYEETLEEKCESRLDYVLHKAESSMIASDLYCSRRGGEHECPALEGVRDDD